MVSFSYTKYMLIQAKDTIYIHSIPKTASVNLQKLPSSLFSF